jgi:serine/threonine protein kinase
MLTVGQLVRVFPGSRDMSEKMSEPLSERAKASVASMSLSCSGNIGPYRIIRPIGSGGMGAVYEAFHEKIARRVAIKILHPEFARDGEMTTRFFNEARAVNLIGHPGLVQVSDYLREPDGRACIVMEYLSGDSLGVRLRRGRLSENQALLIAWQIADTLTAVHAKAIVHRDLKPDNVILVPDVIVPGGERVKLLDFGIAKLGNEASAARVNTQANLIMGTPSYMSPEQCIGARFVDDRTDVYALGIMLFEMLTGRLPFVAPENRQLIAMHICCPPPSLHSVMPELSLELESLVGPLLGKDPKQRPTMGAVFAALTRHASARGLLRPGQGPNLSTRYVLPSFALAAGALLYGGIGLTVAVFSPNLLGGLVSAARVVSRAETGLEPRWPENLQAQTASGHSGDLASLPPDLSSMPVTDPTAASLEAQAPRANIRKLSAPKRSVQPLLKAPLDLGNRHEPVQPED